MKHGIPAFVEASYLAMANKLTPHYVAISNDHTIFRGDDDEVDTFAENRCSFILYSDKSLKSCDDFT